MLIEAAATAHPYDVAILDGELPDINTLELGKAIKARTKSPKRYSLSFFQWAVILNH